MDLKHNEDNVRNIISTVQICVFFIAIIGLYFSPVIPDEMKNILIIALVVVFAIIYIILEINTIKKEISSLKEKIN